MITGRKIYEKLAPYGIDFDTVNDVMHRIGDKDAHRLLPVQSEMKGVILDDLGNEVMELPYDDWTSATRDGSLGQVMVRVPEHWIKFDGTRASNTINRVWLSATPRSGFTHIPRYYVGAYEASLQRSTNKLCSIVNTTADYRGGNNQSAWDGTYRSQLGMPATSISLTNFRTYARNRNNGDTRWNCNVYDAHKWLFWLFAVEYCTFNSQAAFNANLDANGYHQGGLGAGVTDWNDTSWNNYNGRYPIVPCGYTDELGNGTGVKSLAVKDANNSTLVTVSVPRYRGIENPFGHIWKWTDGVLVNVVSGTSGTSAVYACSRPSLFSSTSYSNYRSVGNEARSNGYVKEIHFGQYGDITAKKVGGSADTYYHDYHYVNIDSTSLRGLLFGGNTLNGATAGLVSSNSHHVPTYTNPAVGSRLCFVA
jgi:hypothetical protein